MKEDAVSEAMEEIQRLRTEVKRGTEYGEYMNTQTKELNRQLEGMTKARDRFCDSINRLAEIVGLSGKRCFAPEAVERKAKFELATLRERVVELEVFRTKIMEDRDRLAASRAERGGEVIEVEQRNESLRLQIASLKERLKEVEELTARRFPIQGGPSIPWSMIGPHDRQCRENHGRQSLVDIRRRGGLSPSEALAVLDDEPWTRSKWGGFTCEGKGDHPKEKAARDELERRRAAFEDEANDLREEIAALKEYRTSVCPEKRGPDEGGFTQEEAHFWKQVAERDGSEIQRLKKAAVDCDFRILNPCPVLKGEDIERLDPVEACPEEADWGQNGDKEVYGPGSVPAINRETPFPQCAELPECPEKDCHHYEPKDGSCGRATLAGEEEEGD